MVFENVTNTLNKVSEVMKLSDREKQHLLTFKRISHAELEVDGEKYLAWRIVHSGALGPGKGGIRFHPGVSEDEVKSLSFWMSIKNSLAGIPLGGAKGGVQINPKELGVGGNSAEENEKIKQEKLEKVSRAFIQAFHNVLGQDIDIPAPDVYTNPQTMGWMLDEFEKIKGRHEPGMITGKPVALGGIPLRGAATAKGGYIIFKEILAKLAKESGQDVKNVTIALQGFGNAGYHFANMASKDGFKIVAVSDSKGAIQDPNGFKIEDIKRKKDEEGSVTCCFGNKISNEELLELEVDFLVLAALENQVTKDNADKIKAKYIIELANGPVSSEADDVLYNKGITVVPDVLANAGGVVGSYLEWVQNKSGMIFEEEYLVKKLEKIMNDNFHAVDNVHKDKNVNMRVAAYVLAIERILGAEKARGHI